MTSYGTMIDATGGALNGLLSALGSNNPQTIASYTTGTTSNPDIMATPAQFAELAGRVGVFRYDQSPALLDFAKGIADGADIENGAGTVVAAVDAAQQREANGWYSWFYLSESNLAEARTAVEGAKLARVQFIVADWALSQAQAQAFLAANDDVAAVQWASPSSNPGTICPGTSRTLAQLNVDLNVTRAGWFVKASNPPPPPKTIQALLVQADLMSSYVTSIDGKTWTLTP
jgi:hypothetical protein